MHIIGKSHKRQKKNPNVADGLIFTVLANNNRVNTFKK